ncbi:hypothetical protein BaRGS_00005447 [Batillaria attramentaria]|uniref:Uncharacterized protein n=1 Tax=Batillaria attramentaria TaxID=370345 RepID=A0ABD0LV17_9CAEN
MCQENSHVHSEDYIFDVVCVFDVKKTPISILRSLDVNRAPLLPMPQHLKEYRGYENNHRHFKVCITEFRKNALLHFKKCITDVKKTSISISRSKYLMSGKHPSPFQGMHMSRTCQSPLQEVQMSRQRSPYLLPVGV